VPTDSGTAGASRPRERAAQIVLALAAAVLLVHAVLSLHGDWVPPQLDEMTCAGAGVRLAGRDVPYVDFHVFLPPFLLLLHAAIHAAAGASLLAFRGVALMAWILSWALAARGLSGFGASTRVSAACLGAAACFAWWPHSYHHWWGMLALLLWSACEVAVEERPSRLASAAWCASLVLMPLVDQPTALVGLLAALAGIVARLGRPDDARAGRRLLAGAGPRLLAGAAGLGLCVAMALALSGLLVPLLRDVVIWPLTSYRHAGGANAVPTLLSDVSARLAAARGSEVALVALGSVALLLAWPLATAFVLAPRSGVAGPRLRLARRLIVLLPLAFLPGRHDLVHAAFLVPAALFAAGLAVSADARSGTAAPRWARGCGSLALVAGLLAAAGPLSAPRPPPPSLASWIAHDREWAEDGLVVAARAAAAENGGRLAVLGRGGLLAFHGVRSPTPRMDMLPQEAGYGSDAERDAVASLLATAQPRWILLYPRTQAEPFLREPGALGDLLRARYSSGRIVGEGIFLQRDEDR